MQQSRQSRKVARYGALLGPQSHPLLALPVRSYLVDRMDMYDGGDPLVLVHSVGRIACHFGPLVLLKFIVFPTTVDPRLKNE